MSTAYGVSAVTLGINTKVTVAQINIGCAIVANESPYTLTCSVDGTGSTKTIQALTVDRVDIPAFGFTGNLIFTPTAVLTNTANAPSYALIVDTYGINEVVNGVYPIALARAVNVGNAVTTNVTNSTLIFDGATPGTQFIESKPSGDTNSTVTLDNSANLVLGDALHAGSITLQGNETIGGTLGVTGNTTLAGVTTGVLTCGGGYSQSGGDMALNTHNITSGNNITITGNISCNKTSSLIDCGGYSQVAGDMALNTHNITSGNNISVTGIVSALGFNLGGGSGSNYALYTNSLSRWSDFSGTGSVTVNHNLGATPSFAWCWCDAAASSQTMGNTQTSTQVTVTAGAGLHWHGCAVRY